jgi:acetyltransferase-like isoleucine patch superfamily enzyme
VDVDYHQFTQSAGLRLAMRIAGILTWPIILPLAAISRLSDFIFRTVSEMLSLAPYLFGTIIRTEFYKWTLTRCGKNVVVGFGTFFIYRDVEIGDHVLIGNYNIIHYCDFGSYVVIADGCQFLSGSRHHNIDRTDIPMALQGGKVRRIRIDSDCWIGARALIMNDVGQGSVVGAGAVVTEPVDRYAVVVGCPARVVRRRVQNELGAGIVNIASPGLGSDWSKSSRVAHSVPVKEA